MLLDNKYVVFKRHDFYARADQGLAPLESDIIEDAVVIRRQDMAAPPILDAYANFYLAVKDILMATSGPTEQIEKCSQLAQYFHQQAAESWLADRKFPD